MDLKRLVSTYWGKLKNNVFYRNIAIVAGGNVTARLIGIVSAPIITKLYLPADYGIYSIFGSIFGIVGSLATLRYAVTIPIAESEKLSDNILKLCFFITSSLSLLWVVCVALFGDFFAAKYNTNRIIPYLWFIPIVFFCTGIYEALNNWALREKRFNLITRTKIRQSTSSATVKIGLGALGISPLGLFIGQVADNAAGIGSLFSKLRQVKPSFFKNFSWHEIKFVAKRYKKFPLVQSWSQLLLALGAQLPVLLLGSFYGAEVAGVFALANSMIHLPMDLIGQSVAQVYYAEISKYGKNNPQKIYNLSVFITKKLFLIGLIPLGVIILLGPWLFQIIFGTKWYDAGIYARFLVVYVMVAFISAPLASVFNVFEKQSYQLILNIIRIISVLFVFIICKVFSFSTLITIMFYSIIMTLYFAFMTFFLFRMIKRETKNF